MRVLIGSLESGTYYARALGQFFQGENDNIQFEANIISLTIFFCGDFYFSLF